ncbi:hypothetical protein BGZ92_004257, partial [Podila epicladia]
MPPSIFPDDSSSDESHDPSEFDPNFTVTQSTQSTQSTAASNSQIPDHVIFNMTQSTSTHEVGAIDSGQTLVKLFSHTHLNPTIQLQHHNYPGGINSNLNQHPSAYPIPWFTGYVGTNAQHGDHVSPGPTPLSSTVFFFPPSTPWQTENAPFITHSLNDTPLPSYTPGGEQNWNVFRQDMSSDGPARARQDHAAASSIDQVRRIQREYHMRETPRNSRILAQ